MSGWASFLSCKGSAGFEFVVFQFQE
jgi:hypothetical protein